MQRPGPSSAMPSGSGGCVGAASEAGLEDHLQHVLEIAQAPTRGRTCGFGDADRRALSAPLIARLRVFNTRDNTEVPVDEIDISFLVAAADLWSADGTQDMNLVQHPASHYAKAASPSGLEGYRPASSYEDRHRFLYGATAQLHGRPSSRGLTADGQMALHSNAFASAGHYPNSGHYPASDFKQSHFRETYPGPTESAYGSASLGDTPSRHHEASFGSPPLNTFAFQAPRASPPSQHPHLPNEIELERYPTGSTAYYTDQPSTSTSTISSFGPRPATMTTRRPSTGATSVAPQTSSEMVVPQKSEVEVACVKNLIGALTTNGHKLKAPGESGLGIFFVFHDLSVRTEGTFTIRLRLVSIGRVPSGMHTGSQPVLSECSTPPFEVMSAKKFPGMLDPTPMSQAFAKQGLRIPTRKGANRKRRRQEGPEERESPTPEDDDEDPSS